MTVKSPTFTPVIGQQLRNGATVVAFREQRTYWIVLAVREGEYVTWAVSPEDGEAFWGHYNDDLDNAIADFNQR